MSDRIKALRMAIIGFCAVMLAAGSAETANQVSASSLKAARALIGATVRTEEFEKILKQVIQNFSADIAKRTDGADDKVVVRALMDQAGITISHNRGLYLEGIAHIYAKHLSADDLRAAAAFFSSPEGRRWTKVQNDVTRDTVKYAVAMGGTLKSQIIGETVKSLKKRGYKTNQ